MQLRQWAFPKPFQIEVDRGDVWASDVTAMLERARREPLAPPAPELSEQLVTDLCNRYFQLRRALLERAGTSGAPALDARARECIEDFEGVLRAQGIECLDLTGRDYDPGRRDFESLAAARPVAGLAKSRISLLERPAIRVRGRLIQRAAGLVEEPA